VISNIVRRDATIPTTNQTLDGFIFESGSTTICPDGQSRKDVGCATCTADNLPVVLPGNSFYYRNNPDDLICFNGH